MRINQRPDSEQGTQREEIAEVSACLADIAGTSWFSMHAVALQVYCYQVATWLARKT